MNLRWVVNEIGEFILQYRTIEVDDKNNRIDVWHDVPTITTDSQINTAKRVMQEDREVLDKLAKKLFGRLIK